MEAEPASLQTERAHTSGGWVAWRSISRWYWGAIGVIAVAALAQFFRAAPVTTPATVVSAALAPGVTLHLAYPREVRPVLRAADRAPLVLTLQGAGAITYTVALSTSAPLLLLDSGQQVVNPRAELAVNGCCQSSVIFYPQVSSEAWHWQPVEVSAYTAPAGALLPGIPTKSFTLYLEPVWLTWGRRVLLLFAELGLAVSVALALGGWAIERQRREEDQQVARNRERKDDERQQRQIETQRQEALWQSRLEHARKTGEHDLLAGVCELRALDRILSSDSKDAQRRTELDSALQFYRRSAADPSSLVVEACLEEIATRLQMGQTFTEDELSALTFLFDHADAEQGANQTRELVTLLSRRTDVTSPEDLLRATRDLHDKFEYSPAIRNLAIELIDEWWTKTTNDGVGADIDTTVLMPLAHLMSDPRLAHIPFTRRTHLYRLPTVTTYQYPWANPDTVAEIASHLRTMLKVDLRGFAEVLNTAWHPRLPSPGFIRQPHLLRFPVHEDADCAAHLLHAYLIATASAGLQQIDGQQINGALGQVAHTSTDENMGKAVVESFVPFSVAVALKIDAAPQHQLPLMQLKPVAHAVAEEWLALLACSPLFWGGLALSQRNMVAGLLQLVVRTQAELYYRLREHRQSNRCQQREASATGRQATPGRAHQNDDVITKKLAANIASYWRNVPSVDNVEIERLETWLALRPAYFTHTVVVALVHPAPATVALEEWWHAWFHLIYRLRTYNVIVHLLTAQMPAVSPIHRLAEDCTVPNVQLAALLDDAFGFSSSRFARRDIRPDGEGGCRIETISRLLDADSLDIADEVADALLNNAAGSPSRLLHMMHLILKQRVANLRAHETEFKLNHLDIMNVVQTYPKDR